MLITKVLTMPLKFASNITFMFKEAGEIPLRYTAAKKAGFGAVESAFPVGFAADEVQKACEASGVKQVLLNIHPGDAEDGGKGLAAIAGAEEKFRACLETSIQYCKALSCKKLHVMAGVATREAGAETYEHNIRHAAERLAQEDIVGLIEPISPQAVPGYFLNDYSYALDLVKKINSKNLLLQVDLFHLQNITGNVTNNLKQLLPYTGHVQIAQPPHRHEPSVPGELDLGFVLSQLEELGYSGWVGCEYVPSTTSEQSLSWIQKFGYSL